MGLCYITSVIYNIGDLSVCIVTKCLYFNTCHLLTLCLSCLLSTKTRPQMTLYFGILVFNLIAAFGI